MSVKAKEKTIRVNYNDQHPDTAQAMNDREESPSRTEDEEKQLETPISTKEDEDGFGLTRKSQEQPPPRDESSDPFEVGWDENDPLNPRTRLSKGRKWLITLIIAVASLCVTNASALYTSTYGQLTKEFHVSSEVATLGLTTYVFGLGLGPMVLSPLSEFFGRRPIYIGAYAFFLIWLIPCAVAQNIGTMLVVRFFDGLAGSAFLSVAGGTIGDMFTREELSMPMMVYSASPFLGPEIGPLIGGFIVQNTTWRWTFYVLLIWAGAILAMIVFFVPETYHPVLLRKKAQQKRKDTGDSRWMAPIEKRDRSILKTVLWSCIRPFQLLVFEPMVLCLCIHSAILLGILYLWFGAFPLVFEDNYGFTISQTGLAFLGIMVGMLIAIASDPLWRRNYQRLVRNYRSQLGEHNISEPEFRLPPTILGAILVPIGLFGFGWTSFPFVHWIAPIIFSGVFGAGVILTYSGTFTYLVESYPIYAASALAANAFARASFAAAFPLFGVQMYNALDYRWASSLLAFLSLAMAPFPYLFFRYGKRLRGKSRYASGSAGTGKGNNMR